MDRLANKNSLKNLQERIFNKKVGSELAQIRTVVIVMQEFKMSWEEVNDLPIPTFKFLVKILDEQSNEIKKSKK